MQPGQNYIHVPDIYVNHKASYQGLSSLFSFKSVPSFTIVIDSRLEGGGE
jgi:hypothetical protein